MWQDELGDRKEARRARGVGRERAWEIGGGRLRGAETEREMPTQRQSRRVEGERQRMGETGRSEKADRTRDGWGRLRRMGWGGT